MLEHRLLVVRAMAEYAAAGHILRWLSFLDPLLFYVAVAFLHNIQVSQSMFCFLGVMTVAHESWVLRQQIQPADAESTACFLPLIA